MIRNSPIMTALVSAASVAAPVPTAHAGETVTYEVVSDTVVNASNIEFFDGASRQLLENVPLPWRTTVAIANPRSLSIDGAEVRVDWRSSIAAPVFQTGKWVTVRIYIGDTLRCQNTLDVGNAACYGSTGFQS